MKFSNWLDLVSSAVIVKKKIGALYSNQSDSKRKSFLLKLHVCHFLHSFKRTQMPGRAHFRRIKFIFISMRTEPPRTIERKKKIAQIQRNNPNLVKWRCRHQAQPLTKHASIFWSFVSAKTPKK